MKIKVEFDEKFKKSIEGYKLVRIGTPKLGEFCLTINGIKLVDDANFYSGMYAILEKIKPKRRIFELVRENSKAEKGEYYEANNNLNYSDSTTALIYDIYKEIKENE